MTLPHNPAADRPDYSDLLNAARPAGEDAVLAELFSSMHGRWSGTRTRLDPQTSEEVSDDHTFTFLSTSEDKLSFAGWDDELLLWNAHDGDGRYANRIWMRDGTRFDTQGRIRVIDRDGADWSMVERFVSAGPDGGSSENRVVHAMSGGVYSYVNAMKLDDPSETLRTVGSGVYRRGD